MITKQVRDFWSGQQRDETIEDVRNELKAAEHKLYELKNNIVASIIGIVIVAISIIGSMNVPPPLQ